MNGPPEPLHTFTQTPLSVNIDDGRLSKNYVNNCRWNKPDVASGQFLKTSVSGHLMRSIFKTCQTVAGIIIMHQFHEYFSIKFLANFCHLAYCWAKPGYRKKRSLWCNYRNGPNVGELIMEVGTTLQPRKP